MIYRCLVPIDCEWSDWQIGECSQTCGGGARTDSTTKRTEEVNGGTCEGSTTKHEVCNMQDCPRKFLKYSITILGNPFHNITQTKLHFIPYIFMFIYKFATTTSSPTNLPSAPGKSIF